MQTIPQEVPYKMQSPPKKPQFCPYMEALQNAKPGSFFNDDNMVLVQNPRSRIHIFCARYMFTVWSCFVPIPGERIPQCTF